MTTAWISHRVCSATSSLGKLGQQQLGQAGSWSVTECPCAHVRPPQTPAEEGCDIPTLLPEGFISHGDKIPSLRLWDRDRTISIISSG